MEKILKRLPPPKVDNKLVLAMMIETSKLEFGVEIGSTYCDVLSKLNIFWKEIAVAVYSTQIFSRFCMVGYIAYFFSRKHALSLLKVARD